MHDTKSHARIVIVLFTMYLAILMIGADAGERAPLVIGAVSGMLLGVLLSLLVGPSINRILTAGVGQDARQAVILAVPLLAVLSGLLPSWLNGGMLGLVVSLVAFGVLKPLRPLG